jgi:hypothetical protein
MGTQMLEQSVEILVDELMHDDELRQAFFRHPHRTLKSGAEWGLALTDNEVEALCASRVPVWERVADAFKARLPLAA